jgi:hypothetical protein
MYRYKVLESEYRTNCPVRMDFDTTMCAALMGDFIWLPEQTGCYRILESGMIQTGRRKGDDWGYDIYRYYAGLVMKRRCKPQSFRQRMEATTLILIWALKRKDVQFRKEVLNDRFLAWLVLPVAYVNVKVERLKDRLIKKR